MTCGAASNYLHEWLDTGETTAAWDVITMEDDSSNMPGWGDRRFKDEDARGVNFRIKPHSS
jgi:hypothetical protein